MAKLTLKNPLSFETQQKLLRLNGRGESSRQQGSSQNPVAPSQPEKPDFRPKEITPLDKENKQKARERFFATKTWLESTFPKAFNFKNPKPLKRNIQYDLFRSASPCTKTQIRNALKIYVHSKAYLKSIGQEKWRYDLQGEQVEEIAPEHKEHALKHLEYKKSQGEKKKKEACSNR